MSHDIRNQLGYWDWCIGLLTPVSRLLHHPHLRERLVATCCQGEFARFRSWFDAACPALVIHRWESVLHVAPGVWDMRVALRSEWNVERFNQAERQVGDQADQIQVDVLDEAVSSEKKVGGATTHRSRCNVSAAPASHGQRSAYATSVLALASGPGPRGRERTTVSWPSQRPPKPFVHAKACGHPKGQRGL